MALVVQGLGVFAQYEPEDSPPATVRALLEHLNQDMGSGVRVNGTLVTNLDRTLNDGEYVSITAPGVEREGAIKGGAAVLRI